ncbi:DUF2500 domain-containing protein [Cohnella sp. GCM10027633]|uniref:DUF2500 domain-containing protein n=1 Tax=unclassified Cohnella TaxID=2636738 RepID=UPI00363F4048
MGDFTGGGPGFSGLLFTLVPIIVVIGFVAVFTGMAVNGVRYVKNARAPKESAFARVVAKRMDVRSRTAHHNNGNGGMHAANSSRTYYYVTLEFDDGTRREYLDVKNLYGLLVEGDSGYAAVQGDWIVAFERQA